MARSDMSDLEWEFIKVVLPNKVRGKKRVDDRRVINGIFYVLRTGIPWADLPDEYGPPTTVYNRFNRWSYAGHWDRIMEAIADWSLTSLQTRLIKIGARVVRHARAITFQLAEVAVSGDLFKRILEAIHRLRAPPVPE